jgi:RNA polymerase sigma-70 factor (ECF subfamily)
MNDTGRLAFGDDRSSRTREDQALLRAHVMGDPEAFAHLVHRHRDRLWAVAVRTLGDQEEAADALQEALISAFRNAAGYRGDAAVTTWLHRIVVNACLDRLRRRASRPTVSFDSAVMDRASGRDDYAATEIRLDVEAALATIPETQRTALILVDMQDLPVAEAAQILGVAEGTVKSRCSRGRVAMARALREQVSHQTSGGRQSAPPGNPGRSPHVGSESAPHSQWPDSGRPDPRSRGGSPW